MKQLLKILMFLLSLSIISEKTSYARIINQTIGPSGLSCAVAIRDNDSIVVGGTDVEEHHMQIVEYTPDLLSYKNILISFAGVNKLNAIKIDSKNRILFGGQGQSEAILGRLIKNNMGDLVLDPDFGGGLTNPDSLNGNIVSIACQGTNIISVVNNSIYTGEFVHVSTSESGISGSAIVGPAGQSGAICIRSDLGYIIPGVFNEKIRLSAWKENGDPDDMLFSPDGFKDINQSSDITQVTDIACHSNDSFYVAAASNGTVQLWSFDAEGNLNTNFGSNGFASLQPGSNPKIALLSDNRIAITFQSSDDSFKLIILNTDGSVSASTSGPSGKSKGIAINSSDNSIVVGPFNNDMFRVVQYSSAPMSLIAQAINNLYTMCPINL